MIGLDAETQASMQSALRVQTFSVRVALFGLVLRFSRNDKRANAIAATSSLVLSLRHGFCRHEATADSLRANESRMPKHNTRSGSFGKLLNKSNMIS